MGTRTLGVSIADSEISTYYENNKDEFTEEESVIVEYDLLDKTSITEELNVDENDFIGTVRFGEEEFEGSSEKRASHILFEVSSDVSQEVAIELAENTKAELILVRISLSWP